MSIKHPNSAHDWAMIELKALRKLMKAIPSFMELDLSRVETLADLLFQVDHEIDLATEGDLVWTPKQLATARAFRERVKGAK